MVKYTHKVHHRSRSLKLKVETNGEVVVVTPPRIPVSKIEAFVQQHLSWIERIQSTLAHRQHLTHDTETVSLFGKQYIKKVAFESENRVGVRVDGDAVIINLIPKPNQTKGSATEVASHLERFIKSTAEKYLIPRTHQLAQKMQISFNRISLRQQKSRWGSCSSQGNLNFNWRLVHYPTAVIDYVIIHELAHRREMNHSAAFWQIVRQYDPAFAQHRGWLKRNGLPVD
jgi:predicted metal-dependent hydrolase